MMMKNLLQPCKTKSSRRFTHPRQHRHTLLRIMQQLHRPTTKKHTHGVLHINGWLFGAMATFGRTHFFTTLLSLPIMYRSESI